MFLQRTRSHFQGAPGGCLCSPLKFGAVMGEAVRLSLRRAARESRSPTLPPTSFPWCPLSLRRRVPGPCGGRGPLPSHPERAHGGPHISGMRPLTLAHGCLRIQGSRSLTRAHGGPHVLGMRSQRRS